MFGFGKKKGPQEVSLNSDQFKFEVEPEQNVLDAALKAGVAFPHDCRVGSCGSCACKLTKGKIKPTADFSYVLDGDQLKDGMILNSNACLFISKKSKNKFKHLNVF